MYYNVSIKVLKYIVTVQRVHVNCTDINLVGESYRSVQPATVRKMGISAGQSAMMLCCRGVKAGWLISHVCVVGKIV